MYESELPKTEQTPATFTGETFEAPLPLGADDFGSSDVAENTAALVLIA